MDTGTQSEVEPIVERNVAVMMPFGGDDRLKERLRALEFHRIKFIIEECLQFQPEWLQGVKVRYKAEVFKVVAGEISEPALDLITSADVLIGLMTESNVNVAFEIGIRTLFRDAPILIIKGTPGVLLPIYLQGSAYINYESATPQDIENEIQAIANDAQQYPAVSFTEGIPDRLKKAIANDKQKRMENLLRSAFETVEKMPPPPRSPHLLKLVRDLDPGRLLSRWEMYFPYTVLRIRWKRRSGEDRYLQGDLLGEPVVYSANGAFLELLQFNAEHEIDPDGLGALTSSRILARLKGVMDENDYNKFLEEQNKLVDDLIFQDQFGQTSVLLQFNDKHKKLRGRSYRLSLVAKRTVGRRDAIHTIYVLVVYFDVTHERDSQIVAR